MIQADEQTDGGTSGGGSYTSATSTATPRTAVPRTDPTGGVSRIGGHVIGPAPAAPPSGTETVSQAYLAALASMGKNTSGDTSPYVIMPPSAGTSSGSGIGMGTVLIIAALGLGAWWWFKHRQGA